MDNLKYRCHYMAVWDRSNNVVQVLGCTSKKELRQGLERYITKARGSVTGDSGLFAPGLYAVVHTGPVCEILAIGSFAYCTEVAIEAEERQRKERRMGTLHEMHIVPTRPLCVPFPRLKASSIRHYWPVYSALLRA